MAWGWPMCLVSVAGVVLALVTPAHRRVALWLALPVVSYYAGFIDVVLYNYDRFMLPVCLVLSLFGGLAFDRCSGGRRGIDVAPGLRVRGVRVHAAVRRDGGSRDVADSRYTVEQWLAAHVRPATSSVMCFLRSITRGSNRSMRPRSRRWRNCKQRQPAYYVLNADYARAEPPDSPIGQLIAGLQNGRLGYSLVFRYRQPPPWPWLPGAPRDLVGDRTERPITSVLRQSIPVRSFQKDGR